MISSLGVGSGLDLGSLLDKLVAIERQSGERLLNTRQARAELKLSSIGSLRATVDTLAAAVNELKDFNLGLAATSSNKDAVTATAGADADVASYLIEVTQLARAQSLASDGQNPFTDPDAALGEGTLSITIDGTTVNLAIATGGNSLRGIRDAINASDLDIQAAVVQDGAAWRLLLTSGTSGTAGVMTLTVDGTLDARLASAAMEETTEAQNALYSVNGLDLVSSSNNVADVLPGLTLELKAVTTAPVTIGVGTNTDALGEKLARVVTAYNGLVNNMKKLGAASPDGRSSGPLVGDAGLRSLQGSVLGIFGRNLSTDVTDNPFRNLAELGIQTSLSGEASLDMTKLRDALAQDRDSVEALVAAFGASFSTSLDAFEGGSGIFGFRSDQLTAELKRIRDDRDRLERRLGALEERLSKRFSALDSLVSQFNTTSTYLAQQLTALANLNKPSS
jgi:flagellar hook-associated protein 2